MTFLVKTQRSKTSLKRKVQIFSKIILDWSGSWTFLPPLTKPLWYLPFGFLSGTLQVWFSWASTTMFRELLLSLIGVQGKVKTLLTLEIHFIFITSIFFSFSLFSLLASIILITTLTWEYLFENEHALTTTKKLLLGSGILFQLISVVILSVINWQASADVDLKLDLLNSYDLELGTGEDVDAMVQILATFSTSYNWLVTFGVSFFVLAHMKMASKNGEVKKRSTHLE